ncbi:MAG: SDR family oxidoreductase [Proteobacteria bacterium]|nr:SDR family oxidoreductase [Pseudomonadota bacterium]
MTDFFENKVALITGGISGIGLEIATQLLARGARVVMNYARNDDQAARAKASLSAHTDNIMIIKADVSDEAAVATLFTQIKSAFGRLDFLVNNAGTNTDSFIVDFDAAEFQRVLNVNLVGKFICLKHAIPMLIKQTGAAVNISSNLGIHPCAESAAYNAAAAGIINLTQTAVLELAGTGVRVNTVSPGFTPTPLSLSHWSAEEIEQKKQTNPLHRTATVAEVADAVVFLLSDKASFINGQNLSVNGGSVMR